MDPEELRVREETLRKLRANPEAYLAEYTSKFGNVLNADDAATLFDEYNQDRAKYRVAVHTAATWIRDELFRRALAETAPEGRNRVVFTAGGNAAGKSTAISFTKDGSGAQVIFDSTFSNPEHARGLLDRALAADKRVTVLYVHRPLEDAFHGMLERAGREGRVVSISQLIGSHRGAAETMRNLWRDFSKDTRIQLRFVANSGAAPRLGSIELAAARDYTEIEERLYELLNAEYRAGRITEAVFHRIRGRGDSGQPSGRRPIGEGSSGGPPQAGTPESLP
jgi:hypothetical protein